MLKEAIDKLSPQDKALLIYAFQHEQSKYVRLPGGYFVGVYMHNIQGYTILDSKGVWSYGTIDSPSGVKS